MSTTKPKCKPNDIQLREIDVFLHWMLIISITLFTQSEVSAI